MVKKYSEVCECGGTARYKRTDKYGNYILKCNKCGDTFDAVPEAYERYTKKTSKRKLRKVM